MLVAADHRIGRKIIFKYLHNDNQKTEQSNYSQLAFFNEIPELLEDDTVDSLQASGRQPSGNSLRDITKLERAVSGGKGSGNAQTGKSVFGLDKTFFFDLMFPKDASLQNKVMNLAVDDTRLLFFPFPYPDMSEIGQ